MASRTVRLAVIGSAAGLLAGLFGIGGAPVLVPMLLLWFAYGEREAAATSLAAIAVIGVFGAAAHGLYGNVDVSRGLLVGVPAMAGVLAGTALQQRVRPRAISIAFAVFLGVSAVALIL